MHFAEWSGIAAIAILAILPLLGEAITRLTMRMAILRRSVRISAIALGIITGLTVLFVGLARDSITRSGKDVIELALLSCILAVASALVWYFIIAVLAFIYQYVIAPPFRLLGSMIKWPFSWWARGREGRLWRAQQRNSERAAAESSRTAAVQADAYASAQKRREAARAGCEVLFVTHSFDIRERFTREMFDAFVARHLSDERNPEHVEKLARDLSDIIREHLRKVVPVPSLPDAEERRAARAAVQSCYDENAELLREAFPPLRFKVEMRVRIPDTATPEIAWKQARRMIQELLTAVAAEKRNAPKAPPRSINPDDLDFS